jgi:hypothetical protein
MAPFVLHHFPSNVSLRPEDAPLKPEAEQYATSHGTRNLGILHALADKDKLLPNRGHDQKAQPLFADEIVQLLANQSERRRRKIYDDEAALVNNFLIVIPPCRHRIANSMQKNRFGVEEGAVHRAVLRQRELRTLGKNSKFNKPLAESEFPMKAWTLLDEDELLLDAISERGDFDFTGRVDRTTEEETAKQLEEFFLTGYLPDKVPLVLLNALFGTLHVVHAFEINNAQLRDWRSNFPIPVPQDADGLIQTVRNMRLNHSIAPERTKIVDLLVRGITIDGRSRVNTSIFDHLTDTLLNTADNAHEDDLMSVRFIALGEKHRPTAVAQSMLYNFPLINEDHVKKSVYQYTNNLGGTAPPVTRVPSVMANTFSFDCVKSFEALREQLDDMTLPPVETEFRSPPVKTKSKIPREKTSFFDPLPQSRIGPDNGKHINAFYDSLDGYSCRPVDSGCGTPPPKVGFIEHPTPPRTESNTSKSRDAFRNPMDGFDSPEPEAEPSILLSTESIFARNPATKAGREPYLLSHTVPMPDLRPSLDQVASPKKGNATRFPRRASELPTGINLFFSHSFIAKDSRLAN